MSIIDPRDNSDGAMRIGEHPPEAFARHATGQTWTTVQAARALTAPGGDTALSHSRTRTLANQEALHRQHRRGSGPTDAVLYGLDDLAVAAVCFEFYDLRLSDRRLIATISDGCYSWVRGQPEPLDFPDKASPVWAALHGVARAEVWQLHVGVYRLASGQKLTAARAHRADWEPTPPTPDADPAPLVTIVVDLNRVLAPLVPHLPGAV